MNRFKTFITEGAKTQSKSCDCDLDENFMDALVSVFTDELNEKRLQQSPHLVRWQKSIADRNPTTKGSPVVVMPKRDTRLLKRQ